MRILLVTHETSRTGAPRVATLVARGLVGQGHTVSVVARLPGPLVSDFEAAAQTSVEPLWRLRRKLRSIRETRLVAFVLDTVVATIEILRSRADLVYVNSSAAAIYLRPAKWLRRPVILHVHESGELASWFLAKARATTLLVGASVVACSPSVQEEIARLMNVSAGDVPMLPSVPDDAQVLRMSTAQVDHCYAPDELVVGCCGAVEQRKGVDLWVQAARLVIRAMLDVPVRFVWVGDGTPPEIDQSERNQLAFLGPSPNPYPHMRRFDVFTLPSRDDPFPLVVLEAMTLGTPVVAFAVGGVPRQIGDAGVLVPAGDVASFAGEIVRLLGDLSARQRLGAAAQDRVRASYSTDAFYAGLAELLGAVRLDAPTPSALP